MIKKQILPIIAAFSIYASPVTSTEIYSQENIETHLSNAFTNYMFARQENLEKIIQEYETCFTTNDSLNLHLDLDEQFNFRYHRLTLAKSYLENGETEKALKLMDETRCIYILDKEIKTLFELSAQEHKLTLTSKDPDTQYELAKTNYILNELENSKEILYELLKNNIEDSRITNLLAEISFTEATKHKILESNHPEYMRDITIAKKYAEKAYEQENNMKNRTTLSYIYQEIGFPEQSIKLLSEVELDREAKLSLSIAYILLSKRINYLETNESVNFLTTPNQCIEESKKLLMSLNLEYPENPIYGSFLNIIK
ncbi:hypothetical protein HN865_01445 [Candidatus Woesearchaeota archaeon]|jgi:hypothetical protein|nr:hypothetical protein [Candidatus Woesearchaeota archaeon]MBT7237502.1 hypothetical protein [Candidatus Woesearchaeota archaeon]